MNETNSLVIFTKASLMLAEADTIQKAKELKNLALTAADWAKRKGMGEEAILHARSYALEAERKMGEMIIAGQEAGQIARPGNQPNVMADDICPARIKELGLTRQESSRAQVMARMPRATFDEVKGGEKSIMEVRREMKKKDMAEQPPMPTDKYRIVYADPPWKYGDTREGLEKWAGTAAEDHYPTMSIDDLCLLPIKNIVTPDAVLFMWVTSPLLGECWPVIEAWGFKYKASFIWDKVRHNFGHYNSVRHEILLLCTRGSCLPDGEATIDSVISIERNARHSEKPKDFMHLIESMYKTGNKIELFSRDKNNGWDSWGNEAQ